MMNITAKVAIKWYVEFMALHIAPFEIFARSANLEPMKPKQLERVRQFYESAGRLATVRQIEDTESGLGVSWQCSRRIMGIYGGRIAIRYTQSSCQARIEFPTYSYIGKPGESRLVTVRRTYAIHERNHQPAEGAQVVPLGQYDGYGNCAPSESDRGLWSALLNKIPSLQVVGAEKGPIAIRHNVATYRVDSPPNFGDSPYMYSFEHYNSGLPEGEAMQSVTFQAILAGMKYSLSNPYGERRLSLCDYREADHRWLMLMMQTAEP